MNGSIGDPGPIINGSQGIQGLMVNIYVKLIL